MDALPAQPDRATRPPEFEASENGMSKFKLVIHTLAHDEHDEVNGSREIGYPELAAFFRKGAADPCFDEIPF